MISASERYELLKLTDVTKFFAGAERSALSGISFSIFDGDCIVVSGPNGSGKTVLMTLIAGLERASTGSIVRNGKDGGELRVGLVFQEADAQILGDTVEEDALFGMRGSKLPKDIIEQRLETVLRQLGLYEKRHSPARSLSGGEKRRLAVAGILMMDADVIIFDEPFANLDFAGVVQVTSMIEQLRRGGKTVMVLTHELEKVLALANRLIILHKGRLVYDDEPESALRSGILEQYGIRNPLCSYRVLADLVWKTDDRR
jgi:hypothetical protein